MDDRIIIRLGDNIVALTVPDIEDCDVWGAIEDFDEQHGTDLWQILTDDDVLGVNLPEYSGVPELDGIHRTIYKGARARRIVEESKGMAQWDNDGQNDEEWFAVQEGITSGGWPFTVRYGFPIDYEPQADEDILGHILDVIVLEPVEPRPLEVSADIPITTTGNSLILKITRQAGMLGVGLGEIVNVTIKRKC